MGLIDEFKAFAMKGNVMDMAVGVIIGAAFGGIVKSLLDDVFMPMLGKVVKNVAGFDLCKLFVGGRWTLGVIVEATFKLWPIPREEIFVGGQFGNVAESGPVIEAVVDSEITPVVLDLYSDGPSCNIVIGLAGTPAEVAWQKDVASRLGLKLPASLDYERQFWSLPAAVERASVLPSRLIAELEAIQPETFVARAGNGIIYYRGGSARKSTPIPESLNRRVKEMFDPKGILPTFDATFRTDRPVFGIP
jgi:FAD/FMN-containing dehydrogenase